MLQVKRLTVTHRSDLATLIRDLSFVLAPGDRAAVIGEEGNGKSTLLKLLWDPAAVEPYVEWTGELGVQGLRRGYLAQELSPRELELPVAQFCQGNPAFEAADPKALAQIAAQMGLDSGLFYDWRSLSTLSGGERVKLRLAEPFHPLGRGAGQAPAGPFAAGGARRAAAGRAVQRPGCGDAGLAGGVPAVPPRSRPLRLPR